MTTKICLPAPFLTKTYELVEDPRVDEIVSWGALGSTFVVWKPAEFARDLLPSCFKHNNFSSFVRQLNTYGFRKVVPERWEFANEFFRRDQKHLLSQIHRRKPTAMAQIASAAKSNGHPSATSQYSNNNSSNNNNNNNSDDPGSTFTSSETGAETGAGTAPPPTALFADLFRENEKLRNENLILSSELIKVKKSWEDHLALLSKYVDLEKMGDIIEIKESGPGDDGSDVDKDSEVVENEGQCLKLFGVWLKGAKEGGEGQKRKKRENTDSRIGGVKKVVITKEAWMKVGSEKRGLGAVRN